MGRQKSPLQKRTVEISLAESLRRSLEAEAAARHVTLATHIADLLVDRHAFLSGDDPLKNIWIPRQQTSESPLHHEQPEQPSDRAASEAAKVWLKR